MVVRTVSLVGRAGLGLRRACPGGWKYPCFRRLQFPCRNPILTARRSNARMTQDGLLFPDESLCGNNHHLGNEEAIFRLSARILVNNRELARYASPGTPGARNRSYYVTYRNLNITFSYLEIALGPPWV